jgi:two-component system, OmpR family, response regulator
MSTSDAVVIEDDEDIRGLVALVLEQAGYTVHTAANGADGLALVTEHQPVVTTLDVSMPGMDGFEVAKRIRAVSDTYVVMLTARTDEIDVVQGLQAGADDYLTKPFRPRELRARIEAMLRRPRAADAAPVPEAATATPTTATAPPAPPVADPGWLSHQGLRLHPDMRLVERDGDEIDLTRSEFDLLAEIMGAGRRVCRKAELVLALRGEEHLDEGYVSEHDLRALEVHVGNLRRKLGESAASPRWIETIRGVGYRLTAG